MKEKLETVENTGGAERVCARSLIPDGLLESQVFLSELRLGAQRQVDLQVAVLHPLGGKVALRLGQHGRERRALCHGLLMVAAEHTR